MSEQQPFDKQARKEHRTTIKNVVNEMTSKQLQESLTGMWLSQQEIEGEKNNTFLNNFGGRSESVLKLADSVDNVVKLPVAIPIFAPFDLTGGLGLLGVAVPLSENLKASEEHIIIFKNRNVIFTQPKNMEARSSYIKLFQHQNITFTPYNADGLFDEEVNLYDSYANGLIKAMKEQNIAVTADTVNPKNKKVINKMVAAQEKIANWLEEKEEAA